LEEKETFREKRKKRELKTLSITSDIRRLMTLRDVRDIQRLKILRSREEKVRVLIKLRCGNLGKTNKYWLNEEHWKCVLREKKR